MFARVVGVPLALVHSATICLSVVAVCSLDLAAQEAQQEDVAREQGRGFGGPRWPQAIRAEGTTDGDVQRILAQDDTNKDGKIGEGDRLHPFLSRNFNRFDINADGFLDAEELKKTGLRPYSGKLFLQAFDKDKDGQLTKEEAIHPSLSRNFSGRDKDGNGKLDETELDSVRGKIIVGNTGRGFGGNRSEQLVDNALKADANEDGKLSKDEARGAVKDLFDTFDNDEDGFVEESELRSNQRMLVLSSFADAMLDRLDKDGDEKVTKEEAAASSGWNPISNRFEQLDEDNSRDVTKAEFLRGFPQQGFGGGFAGGRGRR